jgi:GH35 family endo-1,4-beta-xylanase
MRNRTEIRLIVRGAVLLALALAALGGGGSASAVDYSLPSLWQSYQGYFVMGTFGNWNSTQALYHYRSNAIPNNLKLDSQVGTSSTNSLSRQAYVAAVAQINADPNLTPEEKAAAIELANQHIVLQSTTGNGQAENILQAIEAYNAANNLTDDTKKVVRGHVFAWHGGQQPNWFFCNGFTYDAASPDWASPSTMLARLDNYIHAMTDKYAKYSDIIVSWDVVNEAVDDYTGQIRNADDAQVSQWGRIFRRPDLDGDPDARLYAESAWVRQAFESARHWENVDGVHWKLYYNDFQDSNKLYEPKMSQTIKMLKPIHDAGNIDGYGMQGRLAWAYPTIAMLRAQIEAGLTVADEISISESDIRSDFEPNPDYDPSQPTRRVVAADAADPSHQWPTWGSCSWNSRTAANGNTLDVCNSPVRRIPAWGTGSNNTLANSPDIMQKQADFAADWMDLLISYKDKIKYYDFDGTSDSNTFNRTTGGHLWSGLFGTPEKYSFFAVIGAPARATMRDAIARADALDPASYTPQSWQHVADARAAAAALVDVRIYTIGGVNAVKDATTALDGAIDGLELLPATTAAVDPSAPDGLNGWYVTAPKITLTGTAGAGVLVTQYAVDAGDWQLYVDPFSIVADGMHTIRYATTDLEGNVEPTQSLALKVDLTAPLTTATLTPTPIGAWYSPRTVALDAQDGASGVASTEYRLDGGAWTPYAGPFFVATYGPHTLDFRSTDAAGNAEATETVSWGSDVDAAAQLQGLSDFVGGLGLDKGLTNDLQTKLREAGKHLNRPDGACHQLDEFLVRVMDQAGKNNPKLTVEQAEQLLSANQIEALLGCIGIDSGVPAAEHGLLELGATIDGLAIDKPLADELGNRVREIGKQVAGGHADQACHQLSDLSKKIADSAAAKKPRLTADEAALLQADVAQIGADLGC